MTEPGGTVLWDWPHRDDINGESFEDALGAHGRLLLYLGRISVLRGILLWCFARRYAVTVIGFAGNSTRVLLLMERLFGNGRRYLVVLHFIPETFLPQIASWRDPLSLQHWLRVVKLVYLRVVVKPALQHSVLSCQILTSWEAVRNAAYFGLSSHRLHLLKYPLRTERDALPPDSARRGVMVSGRAACDWPTVFEMAAGEPWPLTIVCGRRELRQVRRLNHDGRATVLVDISAKDHFDLLSLSAVYVLALREVKASSGQIRLSDAVRAGTPVVVSQTIGTAEYIEDGRTAMRFAPGDAVAARMHVRRLLRDALLCSRLRDAAFESAAEWSRERYLVGMHQIVEDAAAEAELQCGGA
jgi:hypothetical protein